MNSKNQITELIGWYGTIAILLAYALVSFKFIPASGYIYQLLNLTGAAGIVVISLLKKVKQPAILNFFWAIIALLSIVGLIFNK